jgi:hypothetical protein
MPLPNNRLDDRIRELSDKAVSAPQDEVEPILEELLAVVCEAGTPWSDGCNPIPVKANL